MKYSEDSIVEKMLWLIDYTGEKLPEFESLESFGRMDEQVLKRHFSAMQIERLKAIPKTASLAFLQRKGELKYIDFEGKLKATRDFMVLDSLLESSNSVYISMFKDDQIIDAGSVGANALAEDGAKGIMKQVLDGGSNGLIVSWNLKTVPTDQEKERVGRLFEKVKQTCEIFGINLLEMNWLREGEVSKRVVSMEKQVAARRDPEKLGKSIEAAKTAFRNRR